MTAYLFVLAIVNLEQLRLDGPGGIRFHHKVVMAEDEEHAYAEGHEKAEEANLIPVADGEFANDYVIKLIPE